MKYSKVENPVFIRGLIQADVTFEVIGKVPFSCGPNEELPHAKQIYKELMEGKWGPIKAEVKAHKDSLDEQDLLMFAVDELRGTQWLVDRHRDQMDLCMPTKLKGYEFRELLEYRQKLRDVSKGDTLAKGRPQRPAWLPRGSK